MAIICRRFTDVVLLSEHQALVPNVFSIVKMPFPCVSTACCSAHLAQEDDFFPWARITLAWLPPEHCLVPVPRGCAWGFQESHSEVSWVFLAKAAKKRYNLKQIFYRQHFLLETDHSQASQTQLMRKDYLGMPRYRWRETALTEGIIRQASLLFPYWREKINWIGGAGRQLPLWTVWRVLKLLMDFRSAVLQRELVLRKEQAARNGSNFIVQIKEVIKYLNVLLCCAFKF